MQPLWIEAKSRAGAASTCVLAALGCLLLIAATVGCGPSDREIEATVVARIRATEIAAEEAATATAVASLPSPTPVITSESGLMLPSRIRGEPFPVQVMSLEEARKMYRNIGCLECSTTLGERSDYDPAVEVMVGRFLGNDNLPDAVYLHYYFEGYDRLFSFRCTPLRHTGSNLVGEGVNYITLYNRVFKNSEGNLFLRVHSREEPIVGGRVFDLVTTTIHEDTYLFVIAALGGDDNDAIANFDFISFSPENNGLVSSYSQTNSTSSQENRSHISEYWVGDFDDDDTVEVATIRDASIYRVIEIYERIEHNNEAVATIRLATRDFASNLLTNDADGIDFELLWREHGPSASVAALALILDMPFHDLLDRLYTAVDDGEGIREKVLEIRQSRR